MEVNKMVRGENKIFNYMLSTLRVLLLFLFALFLPRIFVTPINTKNYNSISQQRSCFKLGLENITQNIKDKLKKSKDLTYKTALITNQTGKDQIGRKNIDILQKNGIEITKTFGPSDIINLDTDLKEIDNLIFDIQTTGMRTDTVMDALFKAIDLAYMLNKNIIVLDRPNPIGLLLEGPLVKKSLHPKIPSWPIPLRFGMTIGEIAQFYNNSILKKPAKLHVVQMKNYTRENSISNRLISEISENIKNVASCYGHSFLEILKEVTPFYIGLGTKHSFRVLLLPENVAFSKSQWQKLHKILKTYGVASKFYRYFDKDKDIYYRGLKIKIKNINYTPSFKLIMNVLRFFKKNGIELKLSQQFDNVLGTDKVRRFLEDKISWRKLTKHINKKLYKFYNAASAYFVYRPFPRIEYLN